MEETFASYFLNQKDLERKFDIMHYLKKRTGIFYDTTVIFKTIMAKQFLNYLQDNYPEIELDENIYISKTSL